VLHEIVKKGKFTTGIIITFQVMAFTGMSPGHPYAVCSFPQGRQKELGAHTAGAGDSDDPDVRRIFHPADTGQVGSAVTAPVA
jgi:hypothetical protein